MYLISLYVIYIPRPYWLLLNSVSLLTLLFKSFIWECLKIGAPEHIIFELKNTDLGRPYRHPYFETSPYNHLLSTFKVHRSDTVVLDRHSLLALLCIGVIGDAKKVGRFKPTWHQTPYADCLDLVPSAKTSLICRFSKHFGANRPVIFWCF